jgi:hypothetical protein
MIIVHKCRRQGSGSASPQGVVCLSIQLGSHGGAVAQRARLRNAEFKKTHKTT